MTLPRKISSTQIPSPSPDGVTEMNKCFDLPSHLFHLLKYLHSSWQKKKKKKLTHLLYWERGVNEMNKCFDLLCDTCHSPEYLDSSAGHRVDLLGNEELKLTHLLYWEGGQWNEHMFWPPLTYFSFTWVFWFFCRTQNGFIWKKNYY